MRCANVLTWELNRYGRRRRRRRTHFKSFLLYKPIGASPGRDYVVQTGMVLQIIQYDTLLHSVQNDTSKKGGTLRGLRSLTLSIGHSKTNVRTVLMYLRGN
jgi:hypothetical protein